jgi:hypothetical protein
MTAEGTVGAPTCCLTLCDITQICAGNLIDALHTHQDPATPSNCTQRTCHLVTHPCTIQAKRCLTLVIEGVIGRPIFGSVRSMVHSKPASKPEPNQTDFPPNRTVSFVPLEKS